MRARLYIRVRLEDGRHPFLQPVYSANAKIKSFYAVVNGEPEHHPEGVYYARYVRGGKRVWEAVGTDAASATIALRKRNAILTAADANVEVVSDDHEETSSDRSITAAIVEYLDEVRAAKSHKTYLAYAIALQGFSEFCKSKTLVSLSRADVLKYLGSLRGRGVSPRTIANRLSYLKTFMLHFKLGWPLLKTDRVRYTEKTVEAYSTEDLRVLFAAANQDETELFQFLLCTGVRDREAMHASWRDVDFSRKMFKVAEKLDLEFSPKDKEEGRIPIPDSLAELLRERKRRYPDTRLIFGRPDGSPNCHLLRTLQRLAYRAGLNCGECYSKSRKCCSHQPMCHHWGLHRFRKTFATMHHESGVSVRTIQRWLRHSSLDTTLRYLAGSDDRSEKTRAQVNSTFQGLMPGPDPIADGAACL